MGVDDSPDAKDGAQLFGWNDHRSWRGRRAGSRLRECRRSGCVEGDVAFGLLHQLIEYDH